MYVYIMLVFSYPFSFFGTPLTCKTQISKVKSSLKTIVSLDDDLIFENN